MEVSISITFPNGAYYTQNDGDVYARAGEFSIRLVNNTSGKTYIARSYYSTLQSEHFSSSGIVLAETLPCISGAKRGYRLLQDTFILYPYSNVYNPELLTGSEKEILREQKIVETGNPNIDWYPVTTKTAYATENSVSNTYYISRDKNPKDFIGHDVTFRRLDENSTYSIYVERLDDWEAMDRTQSAASWSAVKYPTNSAFTYPRTALLGIQGVANSKYSGRIDVGATIKGRLIRVYNGSSWNVEYNNNPAWVCYDILTQPVLDNYLNVVRYDGIHPDNIDLNDFITWANNNDQQVPALGGGTEPLFQFNGIFDTDENIWDSASKVANNFRAALYYTGSKVRCTTYRNTDFTQLFSEGNIIKGSFSISYMPWEDRATEVEVTFLDQDNDYESTTISILDKDINNSKAPLSIDAFGTTSLSQAWRFGKFVLNNNKHIQRVINFKVDVDALDCEIGDVISFQHNIPEWGYGGRIDSIDGYSVYVNHFIEDSVFKLFGFTQTEIDNFTGNSTVVNPSIDTVWVGVRDLQGNLQVVRLLALGPWNGFTRMDLETTLTTISPKDPYVISSSTFDHARTFRISSIEQDEDFIHTVEAIEYKKEVFTETDEVTPDTEGSDITRPNPFPHISNLRVTDNLYLGTSNNKIRKIYATWDIPSEYTYKGVHISYQPIDNEGNYGEWVEVGDYFSRFCEFETNKTTRGFNIYFQTINHKDITETLSTSVNRLYFVESVLDIYTPEMQEGVKNLRVENSPDGISFNEQNCIIIWDGPTGENFNSAFSQDFSRYDWVSADWLDGYILTIYDADTSAVLSSHTTKIPYFNYTYDLNIKDGLNRTFTVGVAAKDIDGNLGFERFITPSNPQTGQVTGVSVEEDFSSVEIFWNAVKEPDLDGYVIFIDGVSGFTPSEDNIYTRVGKNTNSSYISSLDDGTWYVRVAAFDLFGEEGLTYSEEVAFVMDSVIKATDVTGFAEEFSDLYNVPILEGDSWSNSDPNISWNEHSLWYKGVEYVIPSGTTSASYIYWDNTSPSSYQYTNDISVFQALQEANEDYQIAINYGTGYELGWDSRANMVIGTAKIGDAAVQNAQIGNIIQSSDGGATWQIDKEGDITANSITLGGTANIVEGWRDGTTTYMNGGMVATGTVLAKTIEADQISALYKEDIDAEAVAQLSFGDTITYTNTSCLGSISISNTDSYRSYKVLVAFMGRSGVEALDGCTDEFTNHSQIFGIWAGADNKIFDYGWSPIGEDAKAGGVTYTIPKNTSVTFSVRAAKTFTCLTLRYTGNLTITGVRN
jgi:hypothetical protein